MAGPLKNPGSTVFPQFVVVDPRSARSPVRHSVRVRVMMTVNLFAAVLLSLLLTDSLARNEHGRIVTVSSASHAQGGRPFLDDIELKDHPYLP